MSQVSYTNDLTVPLWAIESARGLDHLLAQQLVATGESVVDVPAVLSTRTRLLGSGRAQKNDPNDARSVAIAALRNRGLTRVCLDRRASSRRSSRTRRRPRPHDRRRHRLNSRGNRQLNFAIQIAAVTQLRYPGEGRDYYDRKRAEGKSTKEAIRALKRQISNVFYRALIADARRLGQGSAGPGGQSGTTRNPA